MLSLAVLLQPEILLVTEFCERGDLYNALGEQTGEHVNGEFCWYRRCVQAVHAAMRVLVNDACVARCSDALHPHPFSCYQPCTLSGMAHGKAT